MKRFRRIAAIGGGTGLSSLLRGLKDYPVDITAVVAVTDEGGSSGRLRKEIKIPPPGDIRNCLTALSSEESLMSKLFQHRFARRGSLKGHSFGNIFIAAISEMFGGFERGIMQTGKLLAIKGLVVPVTLADVRLKALLTNGNYIYGEKRISSLHPKEKIKKLYLIGKNVKAHPKAVKAIQEADFIILGPGSLYTSLISDLLVPGIKTAIGSSKASKIYVSNIMTQPGETDGYLLSDHLDAIRKYSGIEFDHIFANRGRISKKILKRYRSINSLPVENDLSQKKAVLRKITVHTGNYVSAEHFARHSPQKLSRALMRVINKSAV